MASHIEILTSKIVSSVNALSIIRKELPTNEKLQFYYSFINSHLCSNAFLLSRATIENIKSLQIMQNRAIKMVFDLDIRFHTTDLYRDVAKDILPVVGLIYLSHIVMVKKCLIFANIDNSLPKLALIEGGRRAGNIKYDIAKRRLLEKDISHFGAALYNQLPTEIKQIDKLQQFKQNVKAYLLQRVEILLRDGQLRENLIN